MDPMQVPTRLPRASEDVQRLPKGIPTRLPRPSVGVQRLPKGVQRCPKASQGCSVGNTYCIWPLFKIYVVPYTFCPPHNAKGGVPMRGDLGRGKPLPEGLKEV